MHAVYVVYSCVCARARVCVCVCVCVICVCSGMRVWFIVVGLFVCFLLFIFWGFFGGRCFCGGVVFWCVVGFVVVFLTTYIYLYFQEFIEHLSC